MQSSISTAAWLALLVLMCALAAVAAVRFLTRRVGNRKWLLTASMIAWLIMLGSVLGNALWVPSVEELGHIHTGCHLKDKLWLYVECNGFPGATITGQVLTLPYWLYPQAVLLAPHIAVPLWLLLLYPVAYYRGRHDAASSSR